MYTHLRFYSLFVVVNVKEGMSGATLGDATMQISLRTHVGTAFPSARGRPRYLLKARHAKPGDDIFNHKEGWKIEGEQVARE